MGKIFVAQRPEDAVFARFAGKSARRFYQNRNSLTILDRKKAPLGDGWQAFAGIIGESHFVVVLNPEGAAVHAELLACVDPSNYPFGTPDLFARFSGAREHDLRSGRSKDPGFYRVRLWIADPVIPSALEALTPHRERQILNREMSFLPPKKQGYHPKTVVRLYLENGKLVTVTRHEYAFRGIDKITPILTTSVFHIPR